MRIIRSCVVLAALICTTLVPALAQDRYPNRPVRFVVSFAAGGSNDIIARVLCEWLSEHFGQQFIVENRTGASGNVGAQSVINSPPGRLHRHVRRAEQRDQPVGVQEAAVRFHARHRAGRPAS
jgi:tripartite-type tricarboxylate transporter receptor subunit TctC